MRELDAQIRCKEELLERVSDELGRARDHLDMALEELRVGYPSVFLLERMEHAYQELMLIGAFVPGLAPARMRQ